MAAPSPQQSWCGRLFLPGAADPFGDLRPWSAEPSLQPLVRSMVLVETFGPPGLNVLGGRSCRPRHCRQHGESRRLALEAITIATATVMVDATLPHAPCRTAGQSWAPRRCPRRGRCCLTEACPREARAAHSDLLWSIKPAVGRLGSAARWLFGSGLQAAGRLPTCYPHLGTVWMRRGTPLVARSRGMLTAIKPRRNGTIARDGGVRWPGRWGDTPIRRGGCRWSRPACRRCSVPAASARDAAVR